MAGLGRRMRSASILILGLLLVGWVKPQLPTSAKLATQKDLTLSHIVLEVNGKRHVVPANQEVVLVRGDKVRIDGASLNQSDKPIGRVNVLGYTNPDRKPGEDRGYVIRTESELLRGWSEGKQGELFAVAAETGDVLHGAIYLRLIEPRLKYAVISVNKETRILRNGEQIRVKGADLVDVDEVVTNMSEDSNVTFQIVALVADGETAFREPSPGEVRDYEIRFLRYDDVFAAIPMQVEF